MKKLFFFKPSPSRNGTNNAGSSLLSTDQQLNDSRSFSDGPSLARSRSLASASFFVEGLPNGTGIPPRQSFHSSGRSRTPVKRAKPKRSDRGTVKATRDTGRHRSSSSSSSSISRSGSLANSSSSNLSNKVLDRYIDGEQQQERRKTKSGPLQRNIVANGRPTPRVQYTSPNSPINSMKDHPKSHSFREGKAIHRRFSSKELAENGVCHDSPRKVAKNVIERLSQTHAFRPPSSDFDCDYPITIEDIYGGSVNVCFNSAFDVPDCKSSFPEEPNKSYKNFDDVQFEGASDLELQQRSREAEDRVVLLSEELERESFPQDSWLDMPSLIQSFRKLNAHRVTLAIEVSSVLKSRIVERDFAKKELQLARMDFETYSCRLEKEKDELQSAMGRELDQRSSEWSLKLQKYQLEEQRLRDQVRELAEQNVSLQMEVSCLKERGTKSQSMMTHSEQQLELLTSNMEALKQENQVLKQNLSEVQEKYTAADEKQDCLKRNFGEKEKECKELQKSITRLARTCSEQQKTVEGLRERIIETEKQQSPNKYTKQVTQLQMEQMRLTGVELDLRRGVESFRVEVDSLRHENITLLNRLKGNGKEFDALTFKLDKEMWARVCCLQNQGLPMLRECTQLSSKLLESLKGKVGQLGTEAGLDAQFIIESEVKVQGFKHGTESLTKSLQTISSMLQEKSNLVMNSQSLDGNDDGPKNQIPRTREETLRFELGAETLLTSLLRDKLYAKELEVEQLQAEVAAAVRGNEVLQCEVQNALDNLSCTNYKLKDIELKMLNKDESINRLQNDLQESIKELTIVRGILPKVSEERDKMWEKVKQCAEQNMLLNSEVDFLKKKVEMLDEDILLKEGQITILKDTLGTRPYDLLSSPEASREFLLR